MESNHPTNQNIKHHVKSAVYALRSKPYHVRMYIIRVGTIIVGLFIALLWIMFLKHQLAIEPYVLKQETEKKQIISESILKVYDQAKDKSN
jgi:uncharacterized membrane protein YgaE (UPF0421/DUF939 family)